MRGRTISDLVMGGAMVAGLAVGGLSVGDIRYPAIMQEWTYQFVAAPGFQKILFQIFDCALTPATTA